MAAQYLDIVMFVSDIGNAFELDTLLDDYGDEQQDTAPFIFRNRAAERLAILTKYGNTLQQVEKQCLSCPFCNVRSCDGQTNNGLQPFTKGKREMGSAAMQVRKNEKYEMQQSLQTQLSPRMFDVTSRSVVDRRLNGCIFPLTNPG